ncbi:MAG TPA: bifunctional protein-serine/threonine kinase/phosphatase, partial [Patescibacteria group bacterium]|nr:bifunctional protein-serine/threonine kinase/phosphatase [Patescibacteria group bacterium]
DETVIAALADGAGLSQAAREAAERAVRSLVNNYETRPRSWAPQKALTEFTARINRMLHQDSLSRFGEPELITTLSVAVIEGDRLYGLNVGDSRVYLARQGGLTRLSMDHVVQGHGFNHVLERALGLAPEVEPHLFEAELQDGDVALLCSDGVSNALDEACLKDKLKSRSAARSIVSEAQERAATDTADDLSAIVLDIQTTGKLRAQEALPLKIPARLRRGDVIDGFVLKRAFQHSDRVWLATRDQQEFTLKFAPVEARDNEEFAHLFVKETWNATRLQDRRFFPRAFVPEEATQRYYAMEFIEAPTLSTLLRSRRLAIDEVVALGKFLLSACQYLLGYDLVHGDLKPENILVVSDFHGIQFRLVDFGNVTEIFSLTSRAGTATYLAPERFHEAPISERTEVYAIGVVLFQSLTRAFPFGEIERFQTPRFHSAKRPTALNPNVPPWLEAVLLRALSPRPERRYQNYSEMLFDLEHPEQVAAFHAENLPLLERDPLLFYRTGFFVLLVVVIALLVLLLRR